MYNKNYFITLLVLFCLKTNGQSISFTKQLDRIHAARKLSKNKKLDIKTRIQYAKNASDLSYKTRVDSVILNSNVLLAVCYLDDKSYFRASIRLNKKNLILASSLNNSIEMAHINFDLGYAYQRLSITDSAYYSYYKSLKIFENLKPVQTDYLLRQSSILFNISYLQQDERNYTGSQMSLIKAINIVLRTPETEETLNDLSSLYCSLGLNLCSLKEYDKALEYYQKALYVGNKMLDNYERQLYAYINLAELYKETKNYNKVFEIYSNLLKDKKLKEKDPSSYGIILNNMAFTMFLAKNQDYSKIEAMFTEAYSIVDNLDLFYEISGCGNDMAEFYYEIDQKDTALYYSKRSYEYAKKANDYSEKLRALKMLSNLYDGNAGKAYLYQYITLSDSLIHLERASRNKYARIQFETDQYIKQTARLNTQNVLIVAISSILLLVLGLLYFIKLQKSKNKAFQYKTEQKIANQEIYKLMLQQHTKQEEGRLQERHRIAEDLHDGILTRLFGARMGMGFLDVKGDEHTLKQHKTFIDEIQSIEKEVRDVSHELRNNTIGFKTNFESIIDTYIKAQSTIGNFDYKILNNDVINFELFKETTRVEIYRILQEALQNILKHANAKFVSIFFTLQETTLKINIIDDGIGFNTEKKHKGIGLKNIASRVSKLNGKLIINSNKDGKGTVLVIEIPVKIDFNHE